MPRRLLFSVAVGPEYKEQICFSRDAVPLVQRIVDGAKPLEIVEHHVASLLPIYDSLYYHWKWAGKTWNAISTLLEATAAAIAVKRNAKVFLRSSDGLIDVQ